MTYDELSTTMTKLDSVIKEIKRIENALLDLDDESKTVVIINRGFQQEHIIHINAGVVQALLTGELTRLMKETDLLSKKIGGFSYKWDKTA